MAAVGVSALGLLDRSARRAPQEAAAPVAAEQSTEVPTAAPAATDLPSPEPSPSPNPRLEAAMSDPWGHVAVHPGRAIRIGLALPFEAGGDIVELALDQERAALLAVDEFGPIHGFQVEVVPANSGCSAEGGEAAADTLLSQDGIAGIVGTTCSGALEAAMTRFDEARIVFISPSSTADHLRDAGLPTFHRVALRNGVNPHGDDPVADPSSPEYQSFAARFEAAHDDECCEPFAAESYDAMGILLSAIDAVAVLDESGQLIIPRRALAKAVRATDGFEGVSGSVTFDDLGDRVVGP